MRDCIHTRVSGMHVYIIVFVSFRIIMPHDDHEALTENPVILTIEVTIIRNI